MRKFGFLTILVLLAMLGSLIVVNCGDDDDDNDDNDNDTTIEDDDATDDDATDDDDDDQTDDDDDDNNDDTADDDDNNDDIIDDDDDNDDETPPTEAISVVLYDFTSGQFLQNVACELVQSATGESFDPAITTTSSATGLCSFNTTPAKGTFSIKFSLANYVTTYAFNVENIITWYYPLVSLTDRAAIGTLLGITIDESKCAVAGVVQWVSDTNLEEVGCAVVTNDAGADVYYVNASGMPTTDRTSTHPDNGYYMTFNVTTPGPYQYTATTDGQVVDATVPRTFANALVFQNLIYHAPTVPTNPTPTGCTK